MTRRSWPTLLLLVLCLAPRGLEAQAPACGAPAELLEPGVPLPAVARAAAAGRLRVLVVGSASVLGPGTSGPEAAWPARLEAMLAARRPGIQIEFVVRGRRAATAQDSAALLKEELAKQPYDLVLWQTGTVEAARGLEVEEMVETLHAGLEQVHAAGGDAVLVDPQFSRFLRTNSNVDAYREAIRLVAAAHAVPLFRRYEVMRHWADAEEVDLERAPREARVAMADKLNDCLAKALVVLLRKAVAEARAAPAPR
ncbi:SGNH/GDSL hydrolase family protein [Siccirubricoccus sp. KC 17139]|uniref:SGNH/GDSL hydrolase family protein n=1 Tax=Siccirubricoccus soli TaxID=2899147 RepID=A0ABT1D3X8_9PROT|nr:SGNH/GDSL hydrolase family protein [Siccirubricoccus soli]MCO6416621.1 SGNH/GDSL hydrolase family protein [Siccirubricoccus soli]MCP2682756.1 SGNH/GDSL hydrolase family protein [Siccirubricoccus soli]